MSDEQNATPPAEPTLADANLTRRRMLAGIGSAAAVTAAYANLARGAGPATTQPHYQDNPPPGLAAGRHITNPDPKNPTLRDEFPNSVNGPLSDKGDVKPFWYSFEIGRARVTDGGWARQVTQRDLPIAKDIAGVNMRLERGAVRELHWHQAGEWAFMLYGEARITGVDEHGRSFVNDVGVGDLWYFPTGIPHSIQATGGDGCEFLLAFDDGQFSEFETFLITDWLHHTPTEVLAKNFSLPPETFGPVPKEELFIFKAPLPEPLAQDRRDMAGTEGEPSADFAFRMLAQKPDIANASGEIRIVDSTKFHVSKTVAAAHVKLKPGGLRELHWHTNADEWQYWIKGQGRMTVFEGGGKARTMDFRAGDVGYITNTLPHYIENTGDTDLEFLELFKSPVYRDMSLTQWVTHLPPVLLKAHLGIDKATLLTHWNDKPGIVPV